MDVQVDQEKRRPTVEEELKDGGDSPQPLYPQLNDVSEEGNEETRESMQAAEEDLATAPCLAEETSDDGGVEDADLAALLPTAPPPPVDDPDDDDAPIAAISPPTSHEIPAVPMQPYTERQILGLYTNEQMEHNAQFVDMFLTEQVSCLRGWKRTALGEL